MAGAKSDATAAATTAAAAPAAAVATSPTKRKSKAKAAVNHPIKMARMEAERMEAERIAVAKKLEAERIAAAKEEEVEKKISEKKAVLATVKKTEDEMKVKLNAGFDSSGCREAVFLRQLEAGDCSDGIVPPSLSQEQIADIVNRFDATRLPETEEVRVSRMKEASRIELCVEINCTQILQILQFPELLACVKADTKLDQMEISALFAQYALLIEFCKHVRVPCSTAVVTAVYNTLDAAQRICDIMCSTGNWRLADELGSCIHAILGDAVHLRKNTADNALEEYQKCYVRTRRQPDGNMMILLSCIRNAYHEAGIYYDEGDVMAAQARQLIVIGAAWYTNGALSQANRNFTVGINLHPILAALIFVDQLATHLRAILRGEQYVYDDSNSPTNLAQIFSAIGLRCIVHPDPAKRLTHFWIDSGENFSLRVHYSHPNKTLKTPGSWVFTIGILDVTLNADGTRRKSIFKINGEVNEDFFQAKAEFEVQKILFGSVLGNSTQLSAFLIPARSNMEFEPYWNLQEGAPQKGDMQSQAHFAIKGLASVDSTKSPSTAVEKKYLTPDT